MAWLNSDDMLLPSTLANMVNYFLAHPEVDVVYGHRILVNEQDEEIDRWILPPYDDSMCIRRKKPYRRLRKKVIRKGTVYANATMDDMCRLKKLRDISGCIWSSILYGMSSIAARSSRFSLIEIMKDSNNTAKKSHNQKLSSISRRTMFYWNWCKLQPFLLHTLPPRLLQPVRLLHAKFQNTIYQHRPIPLRIPERYRQIPLPASASLPVVSIVTPSFNQAQFLERTMRSVLDQDYPHLEYIIQDGSSMDGTQEILDRYHSSLIHTDSCEDCGQGHALNMGFRHGNGEILAWLNSDDLLLPGAIHYVVNFFLAHPEVDVVYGHRVLIDDQEQEIGRWIIPPHDAHMLRWADHIPQETLFWRRRIWEKAGGYIDETYQFALDWELLLRFQEAGAKFVRLPRFLGAFRIHSLQKTQIWEILGQQEVERLHQRYHGRSFTRMEVLFRIRRYLLRTSWYYLLYYLRLLPT